jgi:hypothetical protein
MLLAQNPPGKPEVPHADLNIEPQGIDVDSLMQTMQAQAAAERTPTAPEAEPGRFSRFVRALGSRIMNGLVSVPSLEEAPKPAAESDWTPQPRRQPIIDAPSASPSTPHRM